MRKQGIIDTDIHTHPRHPDDIRQFLDKKWWDRFVFTANREIYSHPFNVNRIDAYPPDGGMVAGDPDFVRKQHIDEYGIDYAIILIGAFANAYPHTEYAHAIAAAHNDWLAHSWLGEYNRDGVFKGALNVAVQDPAGAAREIARWAGHPHMVQVMTNGGSRIPFGNRFYDPVYEACEKYGFPFTFHVGSEGMGINPPASPGYFSRYIEFSTCFSLGYQVQLISLLVEGVFDRFPGLKVVLIEGGVAWLPTLLWRLDRQYERFRSELPHLKRKPSEYIRDHVRLTTQPLERPDDDNQLLRVLDIMDAENILLFSSDYPHWDFDNPKLAFPKLPAAVKRKIYYENAKALYRLPDRREGTAHGQ